MIDILRTPDDIRVICENENIDAQVNTELSDRKLIVSLSADKSFPKFITFRWNCRVTEPTKVLGDKWERTYGDMEWRSLNGEVFMPWYFLANNGTETVGCGVMVRPNSLVSFQYDASGVTAWFDVRCGGRGVRLGGRVLQVATVVCEHYTGISAFDAAKAFCKVMCTDPILPKEPVYGSNNWYYAYGKSSYEEIISDTKLLLELAGENETAPYMVIDDGWSPNPTAGPWEPNEKFGDMKKLAEELKSMGAKPGIWVRLLHDLEAEERHPEWRLEKNGEKTYLDPSHPEVRKYVHEIVTRIRNWGYTLLKHDFSSADIFGRYGFEMNGVMAKTGDWSFHETNKTTAEIVLDFYRLIREAAGDMIIIGCNTIPHLCAGLVEVNRIGDDTSGLQWSRTRTYGVNTLAFRLCQNEAFYMADADCVGILGGKIDWKLNRQWLDLLARSGSPLFVSAQPSALTQDMKEDLKAAFAVNSVQKNTAEPLDWFYNNQPQCWKIDGELVEYDFVMDSYPVLLENK